MATLYIIFIMIFVRVRAKLIFKMFETQNGVIITGNKTNNIQTRSHLDCSYKCFELKQCKACSFNDVTKTCIIDHSEEDQFQTKISNEFVTAFKKVPRIHDCGDLSVLSSSGIYTIKPVRNTSFDVYCDMDTDGGGWTMFQRRIDGITNFNHGWVNYEQGFGNLTKEFWLGNSKIHILTASGSYKLRIDLEDFDGNTAFALYSKFSVGDVESGYTLHVSGYSGFGGDSFGIHNGMKFSTADKDNDVHDTAHCAVDYTGGWWYSDCYLAKLNSVYYNTGTVTKYKGIQWDTWTGLSYSLKSTTMMVRRQN